MIPSRYLVVGIAGGTPLLPRAASHLSPPFMPFSSQLSRGAASNGVNMAHYCEGTTSPPLASHKPARRPSCWSTSVPVSEGNNEDWRMSTAPSSSASIATAVASLERKNRAVKGRQESRRQMGQQGRETKSRTLFTSTHSTSLGWVQRMNAMIQSGTSSLFGVEEVSRWCLEHERKHLYAIYKPFSPIDPRYSSSADGSRERASGGPRAVAASPQDFLCLLRLLGNERSIARRQLHHQHLHGQNEAEVALPSFCTETCLESLGIEVARLFFDLLNKPAHPQRPVPSKWDETEEAVEAVKLKVDVVQVMMNRVLHGDDALKWLADLLGISRRSASSRAGEGSGKENTGMDEEGITTDPLVDDVNYFSSPPPSPSPSASSLVYQTVLDLCFLKSSTTPSRGLATTRKSKEKGRSHSKTSSCPFSSSSDYGRASSAVGPSISFKDPHGELVLLSLNTLSGVVSALLQGKTKDGRSAALHLLEVFATFASSSTIFSPFSVSQHSRGSPSPSSSASILPMWSPMSGNIQHLFTSCAEVAAEQGDSEMVTRLLFLLYRSQGALRLESLRVACGGNDRKMPKCAPLSVTRPYTSGRRKMFSILPWWTNSLRWLTARFSRWDSRERGRMKKAALKRLRSGSPGADRGVLKHVCGKFRPMAGTVRTPVGEETFPSSEAQRNSLELLEIATTRLLKSAIHASLLPSPPVGATVPQPYRVGSASSFIFDHRPFQLALEKLVETFRLFSSLASSVSWSGVAAMAVELLTASATNQQAYFQCWQNLTRLLHNEGRISHNSGPSGSPSETQAGGITLAPCLLQAQALVKDMEQIGSMAVQVFHLLRSRLPSHENEEGVNRRTLGQHHILLACAELTCRCLTGVVVLKESSLPLWEINQPYHGRTTARTAQEVRDSLRTAAFTTTPFSFSSCPPYSSTESKRVIEFPVMCLPFPVPRWSEEYSAVSELGRGKGVSRNSFSNRGARMMSHPHSSRTASRGTPSTANDMDGLQAIPHYIQDLFDFLLREDAEQEGESKQMKEREKRFSRSSCLPTPHSVDIHLPTAQGVSPLSSLLLYALLAMTEERGNGRDAWHSSCSLPTVKVQKSTDNPNIDERRRGIRAEPQMGSHGENKKGEYFSFLQLMSKLSFSKGALPRMADSLSRESSYSHLSVRGRGDDEANALATAVAPASPPFSASSSLPFRESHQPGVSFLQRLINQCSRLHYTSTGCFSSSLAPFAAILCRDMEGFLSSPLPSSSSAAATTGILEAPDLVGAFLLYGTLDEAAAGAPFFSPHGAPPNSCSFSFQSPPPHSIPSLFLWVQWLASSHSSCRFFLWHLLLHQPPPSPLPYATQNGEPAEKKMHNNLQQYLRQQVIPGLQTKRWERLNSVVYRALKSACTSIGTNRSEGEPPCAGRSEQGQLCSPALLLPHRPIDSFSTLPSSTAQCKSEGRLDAQWFPSKSGENGKDNEQVKGLMIMGKDEVSLCLATMYHLGVPPERDLVLVLNELWECLWKCASGESANRRGICSPLHSGRETSLRYVRGLTEIVCGGIETRTETTSSAEPISPPPHAVVVVTRSALRMLMSSATPPAEEKKHGVRRTTAGQSKVVRSVDAVERASVSPCFSSFASHASETNSLENIVHLIRTFVVHENRKEEIWNCSSLTTSKDVVVHFVLTPECAHDLLTLPSSNEDSPFFIPPSILSLRSALQYPFSSASPVQYPPVIESCDTPSNRTAARDEECVAVCRCISAPGYSVCIIPPLDRHPQRGRGRHVGTLLYDQFQSSPIAFNKEEDKEGVVEGIHLATEARERCPLGNRPVVFLWREPFEGGAGSLRLGLNSFSVQAEHSVSKSPYFHRFTTGKNHRVGRFSRGLTGAKQETEVETFGPWWRPCDGVRLLSIQRVKRTFAKVAIRAACNSGTPGPSRSGSSSLGFPSFGNSLSLKSSSRNSTSTKQVTSKGEKRSNQSRSKEENSFWEEKMLSDDSNIVSRPFATLWSAKKQCTPSEPLLKVLGVAVKKK